MTSNCNMCDRKINTIYLDTSYEIDLELCNVCWWQYERVKEFQNRE